MATFTSMVSSVRVRLASHSLADTTTVGGLVNEAHHELLESHEWSRKRTEIIVATIAQESSGTFSVTNGNSTATITGGSLSSADEGKYIKFGSDESLYVVGTVTGSSFTLEDFKGNTVLYAGTTNLLATYIMFKRWYSLGAGVESIYVANYKQELHEMTIDTLDRLDPDRSETGDPTHYILGPRDTSDRVQIELFPRPTGTIAVTFGVILGHTDMSGTDNPIVPSPVIVWKASVFGCYLLHSKTEDERWLQLATKYDKEFQRSFELMKDHDERKFGIPHHIRDVGEGGLSGTDFFVDRDEGRW